MGFVPADENDVGEQLNPLEIVFELPSLYFAVSVKPEEFNVSPTKYSVMLGFVFIDSVVTIISVQWAYNVCSAVMDTFVEDVILSPPVAEVYHPSNI